MVNVVMLKVANNPYILSVILLSVVILSVVAPIVIHTKNSL
jgi:hypothetical protein